MIIEGQYRVKRPARRPRLRAWLAAEARAAVQGWQLILEDLAGAVLGLAVNQPGVIL